MDSFIVTGSEGYVGRKVVTRLRGLGHDAMGVDVYNSDMTVDLSLGFRFPVDRFASKPYLIHLASKFPGTSRKQELLRTTRAITKNLLAESANFRGALIVSSTAVFRRTLGPDGPVVKPWEAYGTAKLEMEEDFINSNLPVQIIRPGTILGPGRKGGIVSLLKRAAEGNPVILPAGGQVVHPFVHVDDVVQAICQRAVKAKSESDTLITTLVAPHPHTISQTIETWTGRAPKVISLPHSIFNVIGSDYFPIHGISKWHAGALLYDFSGLEITGNNGQVPMLDTIGSVIGFDATA